MEQSTPLETVVGDVLVRAREDREATQNGVPVVAVIIDGIAAVSRLQPAAFREEVVLRLRRPIGVPLGMTDVQPLDLLQEHDVSVEGAQTISQFMNYHAAVEL